MPTATRPPTETSESHDMPGTTHTVSEVPVRPQLATQPEPLDASESDPYDNLACTD
jgi:hypothetical protein